MNKKTAILVFANSSTEELRYKPIAGGEKLFAELTKHTLAVVKSSGLPFFMCSEKNQVGTSFGERFVNAVQTIYDLGFENVITIGNDTPHLRKDHLLESSKQLEDRKFVLGPSADGGFYLMGLHKSLFDIDTFLKLPWQSKNLTKSISFLIKTAQIKVVQLEVLRDIDTIYDLTYISRLSFTLSRDLRTVIQYILQANKEISQHTTTIVDEYNLFSFRNKGSPNLVA